MYTTVRTGREAARFSVRLPQHLGRQIRKLARQRSRSENALIVEAIEHFIVHADEADSRSERQPAAKR